MKEYARAERIGAQLRRELAQILREEVRDPRLMPVTVQEVRVSRDLVHAKVYFTCFPIDKCSTEQMALLNGPIAGFLRQALAHRAQLRNVPRLQFVHDESIERGEHLSHLIEEAVASDQADGNPGRE